MYNSEEKVVNFFFWHLWVGVAGEGGSGEEEASWCRTCGEVPESSGDLSEAPPTHLQVVCEY